MNYQQLARYGEEIASEYLEQQGYRLIEKNFRHRYGELDLIALSPSRTRLVVIEVKTRYSGARVPPKEAVTEKKIAQLKTTLRYYAQIMQNKVPAAQRIDVVAIEVNRDDSIAKLEHIRNITQN